MESDIGSGGQASRAQLPSFALLGRMIAETGRASDIFPLLHEDAVAAVGGRCSVLLQIDPRTALLHPTSSFGIDRRPRDPWMLTPAEARAAGEAFGSAAPLPVADLQARLPALAERLGTDAALIIPLFQLREPLALLVIGVPAPVPCVPDRLLSIAYAFVLAIERARLQREAEMQQEVRRLLDAFSRVASSALNLTTGLEVFCRDANRLFNAERTSIWLHDRHAHDLVLAASSDPSYLARGTRVSIESAHSPAAAAMRRPRAEIHDAPQQEDAASMAASTITVPLKGRRRALGTLVFESLHTDPGAELDLLDNADLVGRQLSGAVENVQLLEEVLRSRREMEKTVNSLPDLVAVCDANLQLMNVNQAFAERVGLGRPQMVGRLLTDFLGLNVTNWLRKLDLCGSGAAAGQSFTWELDDAILGGRFSMTLSTLLSPEGDPLGVILVARDITPQTRLEEERAALHDRLTQSEKLAALGQFIAGIAHELNNPLQAVLGHVELMRRRTGLPRELHRELQTVYREADRAAKIVRNLLVFAGKRRLSRRLVNVNTLVGKALSSRASACRAAGIEIVRRFDDHAPKILADSLLLQEAILNIVINAEQAVSAKGGGRIEACTRSWPARNLVVIEIRDTGPGIPPEVLAHIFEPFYTTKEVGQGTGLGLAITYGIIQEHGGQVLAANHQEGGAVLTLELPTGRD
jgi:two-component system NtrC family sensor kinase